MDLVLFIKQTMLAFHHMDESSQSKRPLDWIMRVDALLQHCKGDHSQCEILERHWIRLIKFVISTIVISHLNNWKIFYIMSSEAFRYNNGNDWCVAYYTFQRNL